MEINLSVEKNIEVSGGLSAGRKPENLCLCRKP